MQGSCVEGALLEQAGWGSLAGCDVAVACEVVEHVLEPDALAMCMLAALKCEPLAYLLSRTRELKHSTWSLHRANRLNAFGAPLQVNLDSGRYIPCLRFMGSEGIVNIAVKKGQSRAISPKRNTDVGGG